MKKETIDMLPALFKDHLTTIRKASWDDSHREAMIDSPLSVINFDKIPKVYSKQCQIAALPTSNDALYIDLEGNWHFIEFKNGSVDKAQLFRKIYDSLIMLTELNMIPSFSFTREKVSYILVYNESQKQKIQNSENRGKIYQHFNQLANQEACLFGIDKLKGFLLKETHTYTKDEFKKKFINKMINSEKDDYSYMRADKKSI